MKEHAKMRFGARRASDRVAREDKEIRAFKSIVKYE